MTVKMNYKKTRKCYLNMKVLLILLKTRKTIMRVTEKNLTLIYLQNNVYEMKTNPNKIILENLWYKMKTVEISQKLGSFFVLYFIKLSVGHVDRKMSLTRNIADVYLPRLAMSNYMTDILESKTVKITCERFMRWIKVIIVIFI